MTAAELHLLLLALRGSLLLAGTLAAAHALRAAASRVRHRLWTQALVALLLLPALSLVLPTLPVPLADLLPRASAAETPPQPVAGATLGADASAVSGDAGPDAAAVDTTRRDRAAAGSGSRRSLLQRAAAGRDRALALARRIGLGVWLGGTLLALAALAVSLLRTLLLARSATAVDSGPVRAMADAVRGEIGLRRPVRVLLGKRVRTPMAGGLLRPTVFLPATAGEWSPERLRVVLTHELVHIRRHDPHRNLLARVALAPYWFHPLAWVAARRVVIERERACDETVVALGTRPSRYARHLLELADALPRRTPAPMAALAIIQRSLLETRLMAILDPTPRAGCRRVGLALCILLVLGTGLVAAAGPPSGEPAVAVAQAAVAASGEHATGVGGVAALVAGPSGFTPGQSSLPAESACWWSLEDGAHFSGSMSIDDERGIVQQIGTRNGERVVQISVDDRRLCLRTAGDVTFDDAGRIASFGAGGQVLLETRAAGRVQSMILSTAGATFTVNGEQRPVDAVAERWRDALLTVIGDHWQMSQIRGDVSTLRGEISTLRGRQSSLRGEISSARGEVSSLRGQISSARGEESSLRGRISSIRGHLSSLRGAVSSERGAISVLQAQRYRADETERGRIDTSIEQHRAEIARLEAQIRDYDADAKIAEVEGQIEALDTVGRVAAIEQQIDALGVDTRVAEIEARIDDLHVDDKTAEIEARIEGLDADRRVDEIRGRLDADLAELDRAIDAIH